MDRVVSQYAKLSCELSLCNKLLKDINRDLKQCRTKKRSRGILLKERSEALRLKADILNDIDLIADQLKLNSALYHC